MITNNWFPEARHGLYSLLERGERGWNREEIPLEEYKQLAAQATNPNPPTLARFYKFRTIASRQFRP